jgi:hypothetical protein
MDGPAYVNSIAAIQDFRNALAQYAHESRQGITAMEIEIRRAFDWIAVDRAEFWRTEIRRSMEAVARAKNELHNARTFKSMNDHVPSCIDERKAVERAEQRLKRAEQKAEAVRKWTRSLQHELNEYVGRIAQFTAVLEIDVPQAMAVLDRVLTALADYVSSKAPRPMAEPFSATDTGGGSMAMPRDEQASTETTEALQSLETDRPASDNAPELDPAAAGAQRGTVPFCSEDSTKGDSPLARS